MKTKFLTFATVAAIVLGIGNTSYAATKNHVAAKEISTVITNVSNINKIEVRGNVQLYVSNGTTDNVKVYNHYYAESALVQNQKGVLRITSYSAQKLVVWITAKDLQSITAYDNAEVRSFGKFSAIDLDVKLYDNAYAKLDIDGYTANVLINNHAKVDLSGNVTEGYLKYNRSSYVNSTNFAANHLVKMVSNDNISKNPGSALVTL